MKRFLIILSLLCSLFIYAEDVVCVYTKDGHKEFFFIQNKPKVIVKEDGIEISTFVETIIYPLDNFRKFTIENEVPTSIQSPVYTINGNRISTKGEIKAFDIQGREVEQSSKGMVDLSNAPKGIYIVKTNSVSFKYLKK